MKRTTLRIGKQSDHDHTSKGEGDAAIGELVQCGRRHEQSHHKGTNRRMVEQLMVIGYCKSCILHIIALLSSASTSMNAMQHNANENEEMSNARER